MKTLTSMTDFVLEQRKMHQGDFEDYADFICRYALFLKQPLAINQFVPCKLVDGEWVFLEEPHREDYDMYDDTVFLIHIQEYQQAKERCLFNGFEVKKRNCNDSVFEYIENGLIAIYYFNSKNNKFQQNTDYKKIEDLVRYNLQLTKTALKEIGL